MEPLLNEIASLTLDTSYSWVRMLIALGVSMFLSLFIGILAARSKRAEKIIIPIVDILQTLPILAFFPFAVYLVVTYLPGVIGINAAVIFLIVTSMIWNMIFGVYEAVKTLPSELTELGKLYGLSAYQKLRKIFIPASLPRLSEQMALSWAIGLFYLVTSEIFSVGNSKFAVNNGIGVALVNLGSSGNLTYYFVGIAIFILFVVVTRLTLFEWFDRLANRYVLKQYGKSPSKKTMRFDGIFSKVFGLFSAFRLMKRKRHTNLEKPHRNRIVYACIIIVMVLFVGYVYLNHGASSILRLTGYEYLSVLSLFVSLLRVWFAFLLVLAVAVPISIYVVFMSKHKKSYLMMFQIIASIPATILLPLIVSALNKNGELVALTIFFLSGLWYVIFSIIATTKYVPNNVMEVKNIFKVKGVTAWRKVYLKAIAPGLITGGLTAIAAEWNASIIAEQFSGSTSGAVVSHVTTGIGRLLDTSLSSGNLTLMLVALVNMTVMIILLNKLVWKRLYERVSSVYK